MCALFEVILCFVDLKKIILLKILIFSFSGELWTAGLFTDPLFPTVVIISAHSWRCPESATGSLKWWFLLMKIQTKHPLGTALKNRMAILLENLHIARLFGVTIHALINVKSLTQAMWPHLMLSMKADQETTICLTISPGRDFESNVCSSFPS